MHGRVILVEEDGERRSEANGHSSVVRLRDQRPLEVAVTRGGLAFDCSGPTPIELRGAFLDRASPDACGSTSAT
ncbi:MAG: hypothetical protein GY711_16060 [bacterium]|nr:hypothetical protein [bacterium]